MDFIAEALAILATCLAIAAVAGTLIVFRPAARRRRRHKKHSHRPKIDLLKNQTDEPALSRDA